MSDDKIKRWREVVADIRDRTIATSHEDQPMHLSIPCAICGESVEIGFPLALTDKRAFIEQIVSTAGVTCDMEAGDVVVRHTTCLPHPEEGWEDSDAPPEVKLKHALSLIRLLRSQLRATDRTRAHFNRWHDIEDAPKDGTRVLLWCGPDAPPSPDGSWCGAGAVVGRWGARTVAGSALGTPSRYDGWLADLSGQVLMPSAWRPLPPPLDPTLDPVHGGLIYWLPIETAPKDGSMVMLWLGDKLGAVNAYWSPGVVDHTDAPTVEPCWLSEPGPVRLLPVPTHWMPALPGPEER